MGSERGDWGGVRSLVLDLLHLRYLLDAQRRCGVSSCILVSLLCRGEAWTGNRDLGTISMWLVFKARRLGKIAESMNKRPGTQKGE